MSSIDYPIPRDVLLPAVGKPPDSHSNIFQSTDFLRKSWPKNELQLTINLWLRIDHVFDNSCQTMYFRIFQPTEGHFQIE